MSDETLEDDVRRALHAKADALVVAGRAFDPAAGTVTELDDATVRRSRRSIWTALLAAAVIIAVIAVAVTVRSPGAKSPNVGNEPGTIPPITATTTTTAVPALPTASELLDQLHSIPYSVFRVVGTGSSVATIPTLPGPLLRDANGKVRIFWVGAEYCPYCAGERWPLIIALSRFGFFSDLGLSSSAKVTTVGSPEVFPDTKSFSFHGATYGSKYIDFEAAETMNNRFEPLDQLTTEQRSLFSKYDAPPYVNTGTQGAIPFVDIGNVFLISGATFDIGVLQGKSAAEIANALSDPTTEIAKAIDGAADVITNALCSVVDPDRNKVLVCGAQSSSAVTGPTGG